VPRSLIAQALGIVKLAVSSPLLLLLLLLLLHPPAGRLRRRVPPSRSNPTLVARPPAPPPAARCRLWRQIRAIGGAAHGRQGRGARLGHRLARQAEL
jgi:hypothetical protein